MISFNNENGALPRFAIAKNDKLTKLDPHLIGEILSFFPPSRFPPSREEKALYATCRYTANRVSAKILQIFARHPLIQSLIPGELPLNERSDCREILSKIERLVLWADSFSMHKSQYYGEFAAKPLQNFPMFANSAMHCTWSLNPQHRFEAIESLKDGPKKRRKEPSVQFLKTRLARITYDDLAIVLTLSQDPAFLSETNYEVFSAPIIDMLAHIHLSRRNSELFNQLLSKSSLYDRSYPTSFRKSLLLAWTQKAEETGQKDVVARLLPLVCSPCKGRKEKPKMTGDHEEKKPRSEDDSGSESEEIMPIQHSGGASAEFLTL